MFSQIRTFNTVLQQSAFVEFLFVHLTAYFLFTRCSEYSFICISFIIGLYLAVRFSGCCSIQGALKLSSTAANITVSDMYFKVALLSITTGIVAGFVGWLMLRKELKGFKGSEEWRICCEVSEAEGSYKPCAVYFAVGVPVVFCCVIAAMIHYNIKGGDATALIGGTALIILTVGTVVNDAKRSFDDIVTFLKEGFLFGIKIFAPVIPIAAFFFLGANSVTEILGEGAPKCLLTFGTFCLAFHLPG